MRYYNRLPTLGPSLLTVGMFDGVHLGHKALLNSISEHASCLNMQSVVFTFVDHPSTLLTPSKPKTLIIPLEQRVKLIEDEGIDHVVVYDFTSEFAKQTADQFINTLQKHIDAKALFLGYDGKIGSDRKSKEFESIELVRFPPTQKDGKTISSSEVREAIKKGDFKKVSQLLNRPYLLELHQIKGEGVGKKLGFPTLNFKLDHLTHPPFGVYQVNYWSGNTPFKAIANWGFAPTFSREGSPVLEVHLLELPPAITDLSQIEFVRYIRPEMKFKSPEDLKAQIKKDIQNVLEGASF
jgi:riboflavin kinase/FMN adenylyltransferase